jgi:hypothetical protein
MPLERGIARETTRALAVAVVREGIISQVCGAVGQKGDTDVWGKR